MGCYSISCQVWSIAVVYSFKVRHNLLIVNESRLHTFVLLYLHVRSPRATDNLIRMVETQITLELGPIYRVTYEDDAAKRYQFIGGEHPMARELSDNGAVKELAVLSDIFCGFKTIEKITE